MAVRQESGVRGVSVSARALMMMCVLTLAVACAGNPPKDDRPEAIAYTPAGQTDLKVSHLIVEGVNQVDEGELLGGLATREDPGWRTKAWISWLPVLGAQTIYFNELEWKRDKARIEAFYKSRGFFKTVVLTSEDRAAEPGYVRLRIKITEGEQVRVGELRVEGSLSNLQSLRAALPIKPGEPYTERAYEQSKAILVGRLRQRSFAYAKVSGQIVIDLKTNRANVTYFVEPGPRAKIAGYKIEGLERVDREYVEDEILFKRGDDFSASALQETQEMIFDLGVFSLVTVQPTFELARDGEDEGEGAESGADAATDQAAASSEASAQRRQEASGLSNLLSRAQRDASLQLTLDPQVEVMIQVKEARTFNMRVGAGFALDSARQDIHAQFNWSSRNLLGTLIRLEQLNTVGYVVLPGLFLLASGQGLFGEAEIGNQGVFLDSILNLTKPHFLERKLTGFTQLRVQRQVQEGYTGINPSLSVGVRRRFTRDLTLEGSYNLSYFLFQDVSPAFREELERQGTFQTQDSDPSQFLSYLEQKITYDRRDELLNPSRGYRLQLGVQEAMTSLGSDFSFIKARLSAEGYLPYILLGRSMVTAVRASLGTIYNRTVDDEGNTRGIPVQARFYGGGRGSLRSFGTRFLSYFTQDDVNPVPIGATSIADGSVEQRVVITRNLLGIGDFWGALFFDVGTVLDRPLFIDAQANISGDGERQSVAGWADLADTLLYGVGAGVWWLTPIGPVRVDLAYGLNDTSQDPRFSAPAVQSRLIRFNFFFSIGHTF